MKPTTRQILNHLRNRKTITALEALHEHGCFRLAARIYELREAGCIIDTQRVYTDDGKHHGLYTLISEGGIAGDPME